MPQYAYVVRALSNKEAFLGVKGGFELETARDILMFHTQIKIHKPTIRRNDSIRLHVALLPTCTNGGYYFPSKVPSIEDSRFRHDPTTQPDSGILFVSNAYARGSAKRAERMGWIIICIGR